MFKRIHSTAIFVNDQQAALKFWTETMGWEERTNQPMGENMAFVTVAPKGAVTELVLGGAPMFDPNSGKGIPNGINLIADDVDKLHEDLVSKGVTITMPPDDMPWGARALAFADPDGNTFFVSTD